MRRISGMFMVCAWTVLAMSIQPVWGVLNNGFETDYVYVTRDMGDPGTLEIRRHQESDGTEVDRLSPAGNWVSLTFAGTGTTDARLFSIGRSGTNDIEVAELSAAGPDAVKSINLSTLAGSLGTTLEIGNVRFSKYYPDSIFVSASSDASGSLKGMAWELDLGLTTLKNTYTGPSLPTPSVDSLRTVGIDINESDGTIYMAGQHLNRPTDDNKGDLIKFTSTTTYDILVHGGTYSADNTKYASPRAPIFRNFNPTDGTPTVVIPMNVDAGGNQALEFYLDTTAHPLVKDTGNNDNLALRGYPIFLKRGCFGQQDGVTGHIWNGNVRGGISVLRANDHDINYSQGTSTNEWTDCDSPYLGTAGIPRVIGMPDNPDYAVLENEYIVQLGDKEGTPTVTWQLLSAPTGAQIDQTGRITGWIPTNDNIGLPNTFQVQASNGLGSDTVSWNVNVTGLTNNGFRRDYIYAISDSGTVGEIRMIDADTGVHKATLSAAGVDMVSLTFLGAGKNDARLFVIKPNATADGIIIAELDYSGATLASVDLGTLTGPLGTMDPFTGTLAPGNIRYSQRYPESIFVSATSNVSGSLKGMAWELDLALTTLKNTYTGPKVAAQAPLPLDNQLRLVGIDINESDGTIYMTGQHLNRDTPDNKGDLIKFTSTTTYDVLVHGDTYSLVDDKYASPRAPIFRSANPPPPVGDGTPTVVIPMNSSANPRNALEFYLDTTAHPLVNDGTNDNLALRGYPILCKRGMFGQEDVTSGDIWIGSDRGGLDWLQVDDTVIHWQTTVYWVDADRVPFKPCNNPAADIDDDGDVDQDDFAVFQVCYSPDAPEGGLTLSCSCLDLGDDNSDGTPDRDGDIDGLDFMAFQACASGPGIAADPSCD